MNEIDIKVTTEGQPVVTSRQVAENFEKEHKNILRDIENILESEDGSILSNAYFVESEYVNSNNRKFKEYLLTRDGFSLLVMGFTGAKALQWKLKYIEAFNKMEDTLKKPMCLEDILISSLQEMKAIKTQLNQVNHHALEAKSKAEETKEEVQAIRDVITLDSNDWRRETNNIINKIATKLGGFDHIQQIKNEIYNTLDKSYGVKIQSRLLNKQKKMALEGTAKYKIDKVNKLDVIAEDKKLINGYINIVGKLAIKYGVA